MSYELDPALIRWKTSRQGEARQGDCQTGRQGFSSTAHAAPVCVPGQPNIISPRAAVWLSLGLAVSLFACLVTPFPLQWSFTEGTAEELVNRKAGFVRELGHYELLEACGAAGPLTVHVEQPGTPGVTHWRLSQPFAVLGRQPASDILLDDASVSGRHLYLQVIGGRVFAVDLCSDRGTRWGEEVKPNGWVTPETALGAGSFGVRCRVEPAANLPAVPESPLARGSWPEGSGPALALEVATAIEKRAPWRIDRGLVLLGRSELCKIRLRGSSVSRIHCALVRVPVGLLVVDLGGRGGITVNGKRARCGLLEAGDEVQLGEFTVRLLVEGQALPGWTQESATAFGQHLPAARVPATPVCLPASLPAGREASVEGMLLLRLLDQFALIQQQMYDNFQQTLLMALRMNNPPALPPGQAPANSQPSAGELAELTARLRTLCDELADRRPASPRKDAAAERTAPKTPRPPNGQPAPADATDVSSDTVHALLFERLREIEDEGKSRWSGLFDFLRRRQ